MRSRRVIAGVVAGILTGIWSQARHIVVDDQLAPALWPWAWALAIATCVVAAVHARSRLAWAVAGATVATVAVARIPAALANGAGDVITSERASFAAWAYVLIAWLVVCTWVLAAPRRP